jgi:hypothetical protein
VTANLDGFLAKMTGPSELRSALRRSTSPLSAVLGGARLPETVGVSIPPAVLGGGIFAIMSSRLRRLLEDGDHASTAVNRSPANRAEIVPAAIAGEASNAALSPGASPARASAAQGAVFEASGRSSMTILPQPSSPRAGRAAGPSPGDGAVRPTLQPLTAWDRDLRSFSESLQPAEDRKRALFDIDVGARNAILPQAFSHDSASAGKALVPLRGEGAAQPRRQSVPELPDTVLHSRHNAGRPTRERKRKSATVSSLLIEKLREYSELSQTNPDSSEARYQTPTAATLAESQAEVGFPTAWPAPAARRAWPEFIGRQVAGKTRAAASGLPLDKSYGQAGLTAGPGSPERVEIQNVFNIEVKTSDNNGASIEDLAEKMTDILQEQALQHGIDVT